MHIQSPVSKADKCICDGGDHVFPAILLIQNWDPVAAESLLKTFANWPNGFFFSCYGLFKACAMSVSS